jgi:hypothetical protein
LDPANQFDVIVIGKLPDSYAQIDLIELREGLGGLDKNEHAKTRRYHNVRVLRRYGSGRRKIAKDALRELETYWSKKMGSQQIGVKGREKLSASRGNLLLGFMDLEGGDLNVSVLLQRERNCVL